MKVKVMILDGGVILLINIFFITLHRFFNFIITDVINHILMNRYF